MHSPGFFKNAAGGIFTFSNVTNSSISFNSPLLLKNRCSFHSRTLSSYTYALGVSFNPLSSSKPRHSYPTNILQSPLSPPQTSTMDQTIGLLGGGQLGQMLCEAANPLGIKIVILDAENSPRKTSQRKGPPHRWLLRRPPRRFGSSQGRWISLP